MDSSAAVKPADLATRWNFAIETHRFMWDTLVRKNRISALVSVTSNHKEKSEGEN